MSEHDTLKRSIVPVLDIEVRFIWPVIPLLTISCHTGLSSNASSHNNNVCASKSLSETSVVWKIATDLGSGVDVHKVSRNAWNMHNIVQRYLIKNIALSQTKLE